MTPLIPTHPAPINTEQACILALVAQLPPLPKGSRRYVPGDEGHEQALDLFEQACGHRPSYLYVENWQELLDSAVTDEEATAFYRSRDWTTLNPMPGAGLEENIRDVSSPVKTVLLSGEPFPWQGGAELHVYPSFPALGDQWYDHQSRQQFVRVLDISKPRAQYIDADERPGEIPPDGNGWTIQVREYTLGDIVSKDNPRYPALLDARDLKAAMTRQSWVAGYLESLSPQERHSREQAELAAYRDPTLTVYQGQDGLWHTISRKDTQYDQHLGLLERTEHGWKRLRIGELYHQDGNDFFLVLAQTSTPTGKRSSGG